MCSSGCSVRMTFIAMHMRRSTSGLDYVRRPRPSPATHTLPRPWAPAMPASSLFTNPAAARLLPVPAWYRSCLLAVAAVLEGSKVKPRRFTETVELQVGLKNYDPQKDKRFSGTVKLPYTPRPQMKVLLAPATKQYASSFETGRAWAAAAGGFACSACTAPSGCAWASSVCSEPCPLTRCHGA